MNIGPTVTVSKLLLQESDRYQPQYRREFHTELTGDIHDLIINRFKNLNGQVSTGALAAGVVDNFMRPAMQGTLVAMPKLKNGGLDAANSWNQVVYRALIHVDVVSETGNSVSFVLTAFSEPIDKSLLNSLDLRMPFYIANIVQLRKFVDRTSGIAVPTTALGNASQLIADNHFGGFSKGYDYKLRPQDVFSFIGQSEMDLGESGGVYDERTVVSDDPFKSEARNALPGVFVTKVLGAYKAAHNSSGDIGGTGFDMLSEAQGLVNEQEAASDLFLRALRNIRAPGFNENVTNYFTLEELQRLSPNDHTRMPRVIPLTKQVLEMRAHGQGETWAHAKPLQRMASFIRDTIPAIMIENMIMRAHIKVSNKVYVTGQPVAQIVNYDSLSSVDITQNIVMIEQRILREVFMTLSEQNTLTLELDLFMNLDSDSRMTIKFQDAQGVEFVAPTFAAPLFTPNVSSNRGAAYNMANDFKALGDILTDATTQLPTMRGASLTGGKKAF